MERNDYSLYKAIIVITLPGVKERVQAHVTLAPDDFVPLDNKNKRLHECTLTDLEQFADQLEQDVWETYQEIRLIDLAHNDDENMTLMLIDENNAPVKPTREWFQQTLVWIPEWSEIDAEEETPVHTPDDDPHPELEEIPVQDSDVESSEETEPSEDEPNESDSQDEEASDEQAGEEETAVSEEAPDPEPTSLSPFDDIQIRILDSEPVTFNDTLAKTLPGMEQVGDTFIQHSKARVRTAGERLPIGHNTWKAVDILIDENALRASQAHALSSLDREVAGVMIGPRPEKQPDGRYVVHVIDTIIAKYTVMQGASVTYTPESWRYMNDKLMERYPDETAVIVGWYHTHPGFGIFLSGMDQFIHQNFFTQKWHIAFVLDPRARTSGFFCWDQPQTRVSPYEFKWPTWANGSW